MTKILSFDKQRYDMYALNLPKITPNIKKTAAGLFIFDSLRRKFVALTPEEWVRQHFVSYLITQKGYRALLMQNEGFIKLNSLKKRCDTVVFDNQLKPLMIIEYKKPDVKITQEVFDQIARYNIVLKVNYLIVSNGISHYCCRMNYETQSVEYISEIPDYIDITS